MSTKGAHKRKVYDCCTIGELKTFIAYRFDIDEKYVRIDGADRIFIGSVRRTDLVVKRERIDTPDGRMMGVVLYQIKKKVFKDYYE